MNIRKKWIAMVLAFTMAVSPLPGAAVRAESGESAGEEIVVLEAAEEAEADAESLGEVEVQEGETADEGSKAYTRTQEKESNSPYTYTWFFLGEDGNPAEIGTEGEIDEEELKKKLVEKYNEKKAILCECTINNDSSGPVYATVNDSKASCTDKGKIIFDVTFNFQYGGSHTIEVTLPEDPSNHRTLNHEDQVDATCTEAGNKEYYKCQECGKYFSDPGTENEIAENSWIIPAKGHVWDKVLYAWTANKEKCIAFHACTECKITEVIESVGAEKEDKDKVEATCESEGRETYVARFTSNLCENQTYEVFLPKNPDKHMSMNYEDRVAATCEETGHVAGYTCKGCGKHFADAEAKKEIAENSWVIPATGHELTKIEGKAATCIEAGNKGYYACTHQECGKYFEDAEAKKEIAKDSWIIPAKGHDWTEWKVVKQPTCNGKGEIVRTCKRDASHEERKELVENPKAHKLTVTLAKDATCTEDGNIEYYTCKECGTHFSDPGTENKIEENKWIIPAKGHDWTEWEVTKTPTCTKKGERIRTCQRDASHVEKEELPEDPKAHTLVSTAAKAPTCTENGNSAYYTCQECGKHFSDPGAKNEIAKESWIIKATGHKLTKTAAKAATCTAAGNSEYYTCKVCGKYYADANGNKEIKKDSWVIKAKGHQIREKEIKPTASKEGSLVRSCAACGYVQEQYTLPRTALKMTMGSSKKIISKAEGCTFAVPKSAKKYLAVAKTGKITAVKKPELYKDVKKIVPVKVKVGGKNYTVKVKLDIPAPNIKIDKKEVTVGGRSGYRYTFQYDLAGATKIKVRIKGMASLNSELDRYISKAKSDKLSYVNLSLETIKKLGGKVTFEITAYYGKRVSKVRRRPI